LGPCRRGEDVAMTEREEHEQPADALDDDVERLEQDSDQG
jgi:hypothetical protein